MEREKYQYIGEIGNYYGGLTVTKYNGKYYWLIENYDTNKDDINDWEEISEKLYNLLIKEKLND